MSTEYMWVYVMAKVVWDDRTRTIDPLPKNWCQVIARLSYN